MSELEDLDDMFGYVAPKGASLWKPKKRKYHTAQERRAGKARNNRLWRKNNPEKYQAQMQRECARVKALRKLRKTARCGADATDADKGSC